jgi:AraC-like DNA-binding protein
MQLAPSRRGGITIDRRVRVVGPGLVGLRQTFTGDGERVIITHACSLVARVQVLEGRVEFGEVLAPEWFVLSVPPRSVVRVRFVQARAESDGLGRVGALSRGPPQLREADDLLESDTLHALDLNESAPPALVLAREMLHDQLSEVAPVRAAAAAAGMTADNLTRAFERHYGVTPKQYCTRARLFDAAIALFSGTPIISAALAAGFNDVSRFYAQFRRVLRATPGQYARAGNA